MSYEQYNVSDVYSNFSNYTTLDHSHDILNSVGAMLLFYITCTCLIVLIRSKIQYIVIVPAETPTSYHHEERSKQDTDSDYDDIPLTIPVPQVVESSMLETSIGMSHGTVNDDAPPEYESLLKS